MTKLRLHTLDALLLLSAVIGVYAATAPVVQKLLPAKNAVKGFNILAGSMTYGKGDGIASIYNGGYELYTKAGVVDAARQMYSRGDDYVEVTLHTMKSNKAALDFLKYWQNEHKAKLSRNKESAYFIVTKPSVMLYSVSGRYFATASAFHSADKAKQDVAAFKSVIDKGIKTLAKPSGKSR